MLSRPHRVTSDCGMKKCFLVETLPLDDRACQQSIFLVTSLCMFLALAAMSDIAELEGEARDHCDQVTVHLYECPQHSI